MAVRQCAFRFGPLGPISKAYSTAQQGGRQGCERLANLGPVRNLLHHFRFVTVEDFGNRIR